jgi:hypothetical protein
MSQLPGLPAPPASNGDDGKVIVWEADGKYGLTHFLSLSSDLAEDRATLRALGVGARHWVHNARRTSRATIRARRNDPARDGGRAWAPREPSGTAGDVCQGCGSRDVPHRSYLQREGEQGGRLVMLCHDCHRARLGPTRTQHRGQ